MNDWTELNEGRGIKCDASRTEIIAVVLCAVVALVWLGALVWERL